MKTKKLAEPKKQWSIHDVKKNLKCPCCQTYLMKDNNENKKIGGAQKAVKYPWRQEKLKMSLLPKIKLPGTKNQC